VSIEAATYIHQLDPANPAATDQLADADNHLRMIKAALKATFPNISGPVTTSEIGLRAVVPSGAIMLWSGAINSIPAGWVLCNGQTVPRADGTGNIAAPDLRNRFIIGAGGAYNVGATGGSQGGTFTSSFAAGHQHTAWTDQVGQHSHGGATHPHVLTIGQMPHHAHSYADLGVAYAGGANQSGGAQLYYPQASSRETAGIGGNEAHQHGIAADGLHGHNVGIGTAGGHSHTVEIANWLPPYAALAYIMKT